MFGRKYDPKHPAGFVMWETQYMGEFGQPWVAWCEAREAEGWEFCSAAIKGRGKKQRAMVTFRRPADSIKPAASSAGEGG